MNAVVSPAVATGGARRRARALRIAIGTVLGVASVLTLLGITLVLGAFRDDQLIAENHGQATAQVDRVMFDRTLITYETPDGVSHSPENGVLYPDGLAEGQLIRIEYDRTDPELAKVAGRTWLVALLPVGSTLLVTWLVALPSLWWLRSRLYAAEGRTPGTGGAGPVAAGRADAPDSADDRTTDRAEATAPGGGSSTGGA